MIIPRVVGYVVNLEKETSKYPADRYRVTLEYGALVVYLRLPQSIAEGDNDIPLQMHGAGAWKRMDTILETPE